MEFLRRMVARCHLCEAAGRLCSPCCGDLISEVFTINVF